MVKRLFLLCMTALGLTGCHYLQTADVPMAATHHYRALDYQPARGEPPARQRDLLVVLPGLGDKLDRFAKEGMVDVVRRADLPVDLWVADAHFGYYRSRTFFPRLREDILTPAREAGYGRIHFVGISLGGFGSLLYSRQTDGAAMASISLLTPYLGEPEYYAYKLQADAAPQQVQEEKNLWPWLETLAPADTQHWYLGLAREGKFYQPGQAFAEFVPAANQVTVPGKHDWHAWRRMWPKLLDRLERDFYTP